MAHDATLAALDVDIARTDASLADARARVVKLEALLAELKRSKNLIVMANARRAIRKDSRMPPA